MKRLMRKDRFCRAVLAAVLVMNTAACGGSDAAETEAGAEEIVLGPRDVAVAERGEVATGVTITGTLEPYRVVEVRAQVPGTVAGLRVDRGDAVGVGQMMATIEAEGVRGQASGAQAAVAAAEASLALARQQLESARTLYEAGAMSELDYRGAQTQYEAARAQLAAARGQAAGATEQARRATVSAPIAGSVSARLVSEGEAVNPGQALFRVVDTRQLELAGRVPVNQVAQVRAGQPVRFSLSAQPGLELEGEVARVEPTADPSTRQVGVYLRLPNADRTLVGGQFATGRVLTGTAADGVVVPLSSLREQGGESLIRVIRDGVVRRVSVTVVARDEGRDVAAVTGIEAGEQVIVAPGEIEDGARVRTAAAAGPAGGEED